jgi:hypothetical protein
LSLSTKLSHFCLFLAAAATAVVLLYGCAPAEPPLAGDGPPDAGTNQTPPPTSDESCDGFDNDLDGFVDETCSCSTGASQDCYPGPAAEAGIGQCQFGTQTCVGDGEFSLWGSCTGAIGPSGENCDDDGLDNDCDGVADECDTNMDPEDPEDPVDPPGGEIELPLFLIGDCITAACPPENPYPIGCSVLFSPGDDRGCVASTPTSSIVYFQAGDQCNKGLVAGTLFCSDQPGAPLDVFNCPINKPVPFHVQSPNDCPEIQD